MFRFINNSLYPDDIAISLIQKRAKENLSLIEFNHKDIALDNYFNKRFHIGLYQACQELLVHARYNTDEHGVILVYWFEKKYKDWVLIINNGVGGVHGSDILYEIFKK